MSSRWGCGSGYADGERRDQARVKDESREDKDGLGHDWEEKKNSINIPIVVICQGATFKHRIHMSETKETESTI